MFKEDAPVELNLLKYVIYDGKIFSIFSLVPKDSSCYLKIKVLYRFFIQSVEDHSFLLIVMPVDDVNNLCIAVLLVT